MIKNDKYKCIACGKSFTTTISNARYPNKKERETINRRWCGVKNDTEVTSGIITTQKVITEDGVNQ